MGITTLSRLSNGRSRGATSLTCHAFTATTTTSARPSAEGSAEAATGRMVKSPKGLVTCSPSVRIVWRVCPRASSATSMPARANSPANSPPTPPLLTTTTFIRATSGSSRWLGRRLEHQEVLVGQEGVLPHQGQARGLRLVEKFLARHLVVERRPDGQLALVKVDVDDAAVLSQ